MSNKTEYIVRMTGGLDDELEGVGETKRGKAFAVPAALATRLIGDGTEKNPGDGTGRFRRASKEEIQALEDGQRAAVEARLKAAGPPPKGVAIKPPGGESQ